MISRQCEKCGRFSYAKERCYADNKTRGHDIKETIYCDWAFPKESLSHLKNDNMEPIEKSQQNVLGLLMEASNAYYAGQLKKRLSL